MKKRGICAALSALFVCASLVPGMQAQAAEKAGQFMDCFLPMPIVDENGLSEDCWGAQEVGPRDQSNGLEDPLIGVEGAEGTRYCYWDGAIIKDDVTGKYYMFASKWKESDGHWGWPGSQAVYATSDNLYGPYEEQGLMWPEYENSYGHNVFPFELKDGEMFNGKEMRYAVVLGDTNRDGLQGGIFVSDSLDGPWNFTGQMEVHQDEKMKDEETDGYFHLSNISIVLTPENTYIACNREGDIAVSDSVFGPWEVVNQNIWNQIPGLAGHGDVEDPVIWYADGLYHCVVNRWDAKYAFYLTSENGIDQWRVHSGTAYRPGEDFLRYEDGTVNKWTKIERPNVYIEDGEVKAMTLSVIDVEKEVEYGNDSHGSKIIVVPFDNEALRSLRDCPSEILDREGITASADTDVQSWSYEAYNFSTGERLEEYDLVVDSPTVSALYQKAAREVTRTDLYTAEQIAALQSALDAAKPLLNQYYDQRDLAWDDGSEPEEFFYHPDDWQTINAAAEQLRTALNGLKGE